MCKHNQKTLYATTSGARCKQHLHEWVTEQLPGSEVALALQTQRRGEQLLLELVPWDWALRPPRARHSRTVWLLAASRLCSWSELDQPLFPAPLTCACVLHDYRRSNQSAPRNLSNSRVPRKGLQQLER